MSEQIGWGTWLEGFSGYHVVVAKDNGAPWLADGMIWTDPSVTYVDECDQRLLGRAWK